MTVTRRRPGSVVAATSGAFRGQPEISIVMPCLNEERTIGACIEKALSGLAAHGLRGEIVVADNGSTDRSVEICESYGVRVVHQPKRGYGNAYLKGIEAALGQYIVIADSDDTYDLREIARFVDPLREGYDLVMGNRFKGKILPGAMTWSHRYVGNPILSGMLKVMFGTAVGDSHAGIRAFTRAAYGRLRLRAPGMEFASEMVINAAKLGLRIAEVPVTYYPRDGESKLRTVRDGWRHLRYMLLRSPTHLFIVPGLAMLVLGMAALVPFLWGPVTVAGRPFDIHAMFLLGMCALVGYQILTLGLYARLFAVREGIDVEDALLRQIRAAFSLERGLLLGLLFLITGVVVGGLVLLQWFSTDLGALSLAATRLTFFGFIGIVVGLQTIFSSFYLATVLIDG
ncbi:MAG TPA: glycosyltransferase family 2 protein [Chloroflexota bacterium]|nr:glycosyltransferase family 2 protein [Chloroflexota bacterium]